MTEKQEMDLKKTNTTALAYIGDAVYEVYVRQRTLSENPAKVDILHRKSIRYVCAESQAVAVKKLMSKNILTEEEESLVKKARNHKISSKPKNTSPITYKLATAFEALMGFLYLSGQKERMEDLIQKSFKFIEEEAENNVRRKKAEKREDQ